MNKKLSVLRRITAIVLCVTLLSSQVVVANDEDSERMDVQLSLIHISEPTRRTPISYAVFCLKKKKTRSLSGDGDRLTEMDSN